MDNTLFPKKTYDHIVFLLLILVVFFIVLQGAASWPAEDDFSLCNTVKTSGNIFSFVANMYMTWGGRIINYIFFGLFFKGVKYLNLAVMCFAGLFAATAFLLSNLWIKIYFPEKPQFKKYVFLTMLCVLWLGLRPIIPTILYWATGGVVYTLMPFFSILWINIIYSLIFGSYRSDHSRSAIITLMFCSFLIGTANQSFSPGMIFLPLSFLLISENKITKNKKIAFILLLSLILGTIILYIAPGNFVRANLSSTSFSFSIPTIIRSYFLVLKKYTVCALPLIILSFIGASLCTVLHISWDQNKESILPFKEYFRSHHRQFLISFSFVVTAFLSILPFVFIPDFTPLRASFFYQIMLFLSIWSFAALLLPLFISTFSFKIKKISITFSLLTITLLSITVILFAVTDFVYGKNVRKQFIERHDIFLKMSEAEKGKDISVEPIMGRIPQSFHSCDVSALDKDFWVNKEVAKYYGLKSIILNSDLQKFKNPKCFF